MSEAREIAPAKLNLALHVRGKRDDGRHDIETIFAFCTDGDRLSARKAEALTLEIAGPFADALEASDDNLVIRAAQQLQEASGYSGGAAMKLEKFLPVAAGIGGGSADAAAALRLLTSLWSIDPKHAVDVAPRLGSDVPACLLSFATRGEGAGDVMTPIDGSDLSGVPVLLVNPRVEVSTAEVFSRWAGNDLGALDDWREGRNDLQPIAETIAPQIVAVLAFLGVQPGVTFARMSGSGATCFALFEDEATRDQAEHNVPREWWHLATTLR